MGWHATCNEAGPGAHQFFQRRRHDDPDRRSEDDKRKRDRYADLRFTDTRGKEQHVTVPSEYVTPDFFVEGKMFDGSSIAGWKGINESDMILLPDALTAVIDPFFAETDASTSAATSSSRPPCRATSAIRARSASAPRLI